MFFLESDIGYNTSIIIKYPFWQMTAKTRTLLTPVSTKEQAVCPQ